jgi:hypothetical protein
MTNVKIPCIHCRGNGVVESYRVHHGKWAPFFIPTDPFTMTNCPTCNGFGVLIATELKAVTSYEQVQPSKS